MVSQEKRARFVAEKNSDQIKVASQRAAHLNLSPRRKTCPVKQDKFLAAYLMSLR
jgi:hypothetical protein